MWRRRLISRDDFVDRHIAQMNDAPSLASSLCISYHSSLPPHPLEVIHSNGKLTSVGLTYHPLIIVADKPLYLPLLFFSWLAIPFKNMMLQADRRCSFSLDADGVYVTSFLRVLANGGASSVIVDVRLSVSGEIKCVAIGKAFPFDWKHLGLEWPVDSVLCEWGHQEEQLPVSGQIETSNSWSVELYRWPERFSLFSWFYAWYIEGNLRRYRHGNDVIRWIVENCSTYSKALYEKEVDWWRKSLRQAECRVEWWTRSSSGHEKRNVMPLYGQHSFNLKI